MYNYYMLINPFAIIVASLISFFLGYFWFSNKMFGKTWMKIHGFQNRTPEEKKLAMKGMGKFMAAEFVLTLIMNFFLYLAVIQTISVAFAFGTVLYLWLGFILPTVTSVTLWGADARKVMFKKILISSSFRLVALLVSTWIFFMWR